MSDNINKPVTFGDVRDAFSADPHNWQKWLEYAWAVELLREQRKISDAEAILLSKSDKQPKPAPARLGGDNTDLQFERRTHAPIPTDRPPSVETFLERFRGIVNADEVPDAGTEAAYGKE
jgi:hypothetical protein